MILIASVYKKNKNNYPQVFLEKDEYITRAKKISSFITDDKEIYSDDSDDSDKKTQMKKIKYMNLFLKATRKT